jgi:hypothetical protein
VSIIRKAFIKGRPCCSAQTGRGGKHCGDPVRVGRFYNGRTCGKSDCQLWLNSQHYAA